MRRKGMSTSLFAIAASIAATASAPSCAQTADELSSPPASVQAKPAGQESSAGFLANAIPDAHFLEQTSRMAIGHSSNGKIREYAQQVAKAQTAAANSLTAWVNTSGPVVTTRSASPGSKARVSAARLLPAQANVLQRLSTLQGREFDALYISTQRDAFLQLTTIYQDYIEKGDDPGLHAIAVRELAEAMAALSRLDAL